MFYYSFNKSPQVISETKQQITIWEAGRGRGLNVLAFNSKVPRDVGSILFLILQPYQGISRSHCSRCFSHNVQ